MSRAGNSGSTSSRGGRAVCKLGACRSAIFGRNDTGEPQSINPVLAGSGAWLWPIKVYPVNKPGGWPTSKVRRALKILSSLFWWVNIIYRGPIMEGWIPLKTSQCWDHLCSQCMLMVQGCSWVPKMLSLVPRPKHLFKLIQQTITTAVRKDSWEFTRV